MVIAAVIVLFDLALAINRSAEFPAPNYQGIVEQPALFKVHHQRSAGLVRVFGLFADALGQIAMLVPAAVIKLDEANAAFGHSAREQTIIGK